MLTRRHLLQNAVRAGVASLCAPSVSYAQAPALAPLSGSLLPAMERSGRTCLAWLNPEQSYLPTGGYEIAHDTGRWWDAMLRLEAATGVLIPATHEAAMLKNLQILTDNPAALLTNTARLPIPAEKIKVNPHNLRETMLAYHALIRWRKSDWAHSQGHRLLSAIQGTLDADGQMDYAKLAAIAGGPLSHDPLMTQRSPTGQWFNATATTGRALEAILLFHEATRDPLALEVAHRLAEIHLKQDIDPTGKIRAELTAPGHVGHTHSYLGALRGLLLYGLTTSNRTHIQAVAATYRQGLFGSAVSYSGWTPHDQGKIRFPNAQGEPIGEHASCGDAAQIALWLALRDDQPDLLDDVERLIRARLLPAQIIDPKTPRSDGAWGVYSHPFGRGNIFDVFAAVLHSLTDFHGAIVSAGSDGRVTVNLHFSLENNDISIKSEHGERARLLLTPKITPLSLRIRVPAWAPRDSLFLESGGNPVSFQWEGSFLHLQTPVNPGQTVTLQYDLPRRRTLEVMPVSQREFNLTWRGDEVVACDPPVAIYPAQSS